MQGQDDIWHINNASYTIKQYFVAAVALLGGRPHISESHANLFGRSEIARGGIPRSEEYSHRGVGPDARVGEEAQEGST
jgi:hypothetical protein